MRQTHRTFQDVETGSIFRLWTDQDNSVYKLIADSSSDPNKMAGGSEVNGFYISAHTPVTIKINGKKVISLSTGQFYNLKEGEQITHKKYIGFKRFSKI